MKAALHINPQDAVPIYRQIMHQLSELIAGGQLAAGDRLPSHRELSKELVIAPLTVKKAYDELERTGLIETRRGQGTFVTEGVEQANDADKVEILRPLAQRLVHEASLVDLSASALVKLIREEAAALEATRKKSRARAKIQKKETRP